LSSEGKANRVGCANCVQNLEYFRSGLFASNDGLRDVLTANDPDVLFVDFYRVDY
jgi:hypothetical protein